MFEISRQEIELFLQAETICLDKSIRQFPSRLDYFVNRDVSLDFNVLSAVLSQGTQHVWLPTPSVSILHTKHLTFFTVERIFFIFFLFYDNFTYMSNMFFQLLAWESMG